MLETKFIMILKLMTFFSQTLVVYCSNDGFKGCEKMLLHCTGHWAVPTAE